MARTWFFGFLKTGVMSSSLSNRYKAKQTLEGLNFKGDHLDFSHLTELKYIYITKMYIKKKNHQ